MTERKERIRAFELLFTFPEFAALGVTDGGTVVTQFLIDWDVSNDAPGTMTQFARKWVNAGRIYIALRRQPIFNVSSTVVACFEAPDAETAQRMLNASLERHGFDVYEGTEVNPAFEAEEGTEAYALP